MDISGSTCTLPAGHRQLSLDRPFADRTVTRRCVDEVNGAHGHFRLHVHAAGWTPSAQVLDRPLADRTVTRRCVDEVNGAHGHFRLHVHAAGWTPSAQFGSAVRRSYRHSSLRRRGERSTWTFQAPRARCRLDTVSSVWIGRSPIVPSLVAASTR